METQGVSCEVLSALSLPTTWLRQSMRLTYLLTYLLTPRSTVLLEKPTGFQLVKKSPHFMEPEGSLPHSQQPVTCPYPEPDRSSPYPDIPLLKIHLNIILPSTPESQAVSFPRVSPPKPCMLLPSPPHVLHANPSHSSRFYRPNNIGWGVQTIELLIM